MSLVLPEGWTLIYRIGHPSTVAPNLSAQLGSLSGPPGLYEQMPVSFPLVFREMQITLK